jgi:hypothetical protein
VCCCSSYPVRIEGNLEITLSVSNIAQKQGLYESDTIPANAQRPTSHQYFLLIVLLTNQGSD